VVAGVEDVADETQSLLPDVGLLMLEERVQHARDEILGFVVVHHTLVVDVFTSCFVVQTEVAQVEQ